jgi:hypothetical protein
MANGLQTHLTFRAPSSLVHKEQPSMAEIALSVGVLAFILALPSGSEVRVEESCAASSQLVYKRSLRDRFSPLCDSDMVSVFIRHFCRDVSFVFQETMTARSYSAFLQPW